jgi:hypothetical protein
MSIPGGGYLSRFGDRILMSLVPAIPLNATFLSKLKTDKASRPQAPTLTYSSSTLKSLRLSSNTRSPHFAVSCICCSLILDSEGTVSSTHKKEEKKKKSNFFEAGECKTKSGRKHHCRMHSTDLLRSSISTANSQSVTVSRNYNEPFSVYLLL